MNKETLNKLKELALAATPGPWYADNPIPGKPRFTVADCFSSKVYMQDQRPSHGTTGLDDALFIAAANPAAVLDLIALAERTTSPVSQIADAQIDAVVEKLRALDGGLWSRGGINQREMIAAILAAAAPHAQAPAVPVTHNPHTGTLRDPRDVSSDPDAILCVKPGQPLHAAQPQPVAEQGNVKKCAFDFYEANKHDFMAKSDHEIVQDCFAHFAASQQDAIGKFTIEVENLLCAKLGRSWSATGISIASLADELAARATAAEAKLEAIRQGFSELKMWETAHGSDVYSASDIDDIRELLQPQPQADESGMPG